MSHKDTAASAAGPSQPDEGQQPKEVDATSNTIPPGFVYQHLHRPLDSAEIFPMQSWMDNNYDPAPDFFTPSDCPDDLLLGNQSWESSLEAAKVHWHTTLQGSGLLPGCRLMLDVKRDKLKPLGFLRSLLKLRSQACASSFVVFEGSRLLHSLVTLTLCTFHYKRVVTNYPEIFKIVSTLETLTTPEFQTTLSKIIRGGELPSEPYYATLSMQNPKLYDKMIWVGGTYVLYAYHLLCNMRTGYTPRQNDPAKHGFYFEQLTDSNVDSGVIRIMDFSTHDWVVALCTVLSFTLNRTVIKQERAVPRNCLSALHVADEVTLGRVADDKDGKSTHDSKSMDLRQQIKKILRESRVRPGKLLEYLKSFSLSQAPEDHDTEAMDELFVKRQMYLASVQPNPFPARKSVQGAQGSSIFKVPMDKKTLDHVAGIVTDIFRPAVNAAPGTRATRRFIKTVPQAEVESFIQSQGPLIEKLVAQEHKKNEEQSVEDIRESITLDCQRSFVGSSLMFNSPPRQTDITNVCRWLALDPSGDDFTFNKSNTEVVTNKKDSEGNLIKECFEFMPHQVYDASIAMDAIMSPIRGCILATSYGLGKTNTYWAVAEATHQKNVEASKNDPNFEFHPIIVTVPSHLIGDSFEACNKNFAGLLFPRVYFGTAEQAATPSLKAATLDKKDYQGWVRRMIAKRKDPATGAQVLITSYSTSQLRWLSRDATFRYQDGQTVTYTSQKSRNQPVQRGAIVARASLSVSNTSHEKAAEAQDLFAHEDNPAIQEGDDAAEFERHKSLRRDDGTLPTHYKTTYLLKRAFQLEGADFKFSLLIFDEAHTLRNSRSTFSILARLLPRTKDAGLLLVSATPILNSVQEMRSLNTIMVHHSGIPFSQLPISGNPVEFQELKAWYQTDPAKNQFFFMAPGVAAKVARSNAAERDFVYEKLATLLISRRHAHSPLTLNNGKVVYPGTTIPPLTICTIEVGHKPGSADRQHTAYSSDFFLGSFFKEAMARDTSDVDPIPSATRGATIEENDLLPRKANDDDNENTDEEENRDLSEFIAQWNLRPKAACLAFLLLRNDYVGDRGIERFSHARQGLDVLESARQSSGGLDDVDVLEAKVAEIYRPPASYYHLKNLDRKTVDPVVDGS
ncbi:uncharacterized protein PpBr36_06502 [Pyricularia pennisetigena]|uniref:uncharacterized protein n=1 Tax=Pyricularia pennisetigena TaxID=1578925 RepID=UPI001150E4A2|nr:uncharacterized protein PpBr36_06502 [Pyricularia pennisetigena]TLS23402.1 hypothetical protein PpBr36_06502 [Pyricularia pennisetigena]